MRPVRTGVEGVVSFDESTVAFGTPALRVTVDPGDGKVAEAKLTPNEVELVRDELSEWLRERGRP